LLLDGPQVAVGPGRDPDREARAVVQTVRRDDAVGPDPADVVGDGLAEAGLGEPHVTVRSDRDPRRQWVDARRHILVQQVALRVHHADHVVLALGEPEVPVSARDDAVGLLVAAAELELGDHAVERDATDPVRVRLGEPEVAVRADRDAEGS
jgi:hypothetical protein